MKKNLKLPFAVAAFNLIWPLSTFLRLIGIFPFGIGVMIVEVCMFGFIQGMFFNYTVWLYNKEVRERDQNAQDEKELGFFT